MVEHEILLASRDEILGAASAIMGFNLNLAGFISRRKLPAILNKNMKYFLMKYIGFWRKYFWKGMKYFWPAGMKYLVRQVQFWHLT